MITCDWGSGKIARKEQADVQAHKLLSRTIMFFCKKHWSVLYEIKFNPWVLVARSR